MIPPFIARRIKLRSSLVRIVDNLGWLLAERAMHIVIGLLVGIWVARYLGPEQFGLVNFASAFVALFGTFAVLGLKGIVVRDVVRHPETSGATLGTAAALHVIGGLFAFAAVFWTIQLVRPDDAQARLVGVILGAALLFKVSDVAEYWFEAKVQSKYVVWARNSALLTIAAVKIVLILLQAPLIAFAWAMFAETALAASAVAAAFAIRGPPLRDLGARQRRARSLLKDSWPLIPAGLAISGYMTIDQIMLGQMIGDTAVGIYSAATRLSVIWYFIPAAVVASVFPALLKAKQRSESLYYERLQRLCDLMVILALTVAIPMTFLSEQIVMFLFGPAYEGSGAVLAIHIWASVFVFVGLAGGRWYLAENRQILTLQRTVVGFLLNVLLNLALIPGYGVLGAAIATIVSQGFVGLLFDAVQRETRSLFLIKIRALNVFDSIRRMFLRSSL
jgi:O-antigen/teichoic acid export membrane protein